MMTVNTGGQTTRIPVTTGRPVLDTWKGTMVVMDKQSKVLMDSRTVGLGDEYRGDYLLGRTPDDVGDVRAPEPAGGHRGRTP